MPPRRSGIADYSHALAAELEKLVHLEIFDGPGKPFDPARFDIALYQVGNNPDHDFVYEAALRHPGVVVMHESNLHHLIAHLTIVRGDWDAYVAEAEYNGGPAARQRADLARSLAAGPDYEGVPMTRRILDSAKGVIVHSQFMVDEMRNSGYHGAIARIHHGAWIPEVDGRGVRRQLGIAENELLIGIFGHLKPYKRIAESLRAFRRLVRKDDRVKMILAGEPHPDFPVQSLIETLNLGGHARVLGFQTAEEFTRHIASCDIVLNLRYPTLGESSGSLLRALGLGKAVLVSDLGSFQEFPDNVCLKVPVNATEEDLIFEYLALLTSRPDLSRALGASAKAWVASECNWTKVAGEYAAFLETAADRGAGRASGVTAEYIQGWAENDSAREYIETHRTRLLKTLEITPRGAPEESVLEMGAYLQITPALHSKLGYGYVRGCYYGPDGRVDRRKVVSAEGEEFECDVDHFDAEKSRFPYDDESFNTVLCCELIEHLFQDPMHLMSEVNRILKSGGHLVLTTPNIASERGIGAILNGYHPGFFHAYSKPKPDGEVDARHNREYTPGEIHRLLTTAGFDIERLETGPFSQEPQTQYAWVRKLLADNRLSTALRGVGIYAVGRKSGAVRERWPGWLYS
ncbi:MAG: glycosyltransferase [Acidobacteriota bacterium]|nr:glycosyltransferase [Acidobacteriota bacterium]